MNWTDLISSFVLAMPVLYILAALLTDTMVDREKERRAATHGSEATSSRGSPAVGGRPNGAQE